MKEIIDVFEETDELWDKADELWKKAKKVWKTQEGIRAEIIERLKKGLPRAELAKKALYLAEQAREIEQEAWAIEELAHKRDQANYAKLTDN